MTTTTHRHPVLSAIARALVGAMVFNALSPLSVLTLTEN